jgi:hypothetical protein
MEYEGPLSTAVALPVRSRLLINWPLQTGKWAPSAMALMNRAREARQWVKARPEKEIVLVSHGGFLHYFTDDWEDSSFYQGRFSPLPFDLDPL